MFFMMGITDGRKDFDFNQVMTCPICGAMGSYRVFMTYTVLSLFFIPCFKWNKRYYVQTTCCNAIYELDPEIGNMIRRGEKVEIRQEHLTRVMDRGYSIPLYKVAYVYDVTQTEGEELQSLGVNELTNMVNGYNRLIKAIENVSPVPVSYENIEGSAKGYYSLQDKKIVVKAGMSESQTLKKLIHETAHSLLHDKEGSKIEGIEDAGKKTKSTIETEAESTAYTVMSYFNLDDQVGDYSFSYIATWAADKDLKELKASMQTIRKTASFIITGIEEKLLEKTSIKDRLAAGETKKSEHSGKSNKVKARQEPVLA